jgi:subtilase family serine protease
MNRRTKTLLLSAIAVSSAAAIAACSSSDTAPAPQVTGSANVQALPFQAPAWATADNFAGRVDALSPIRVQVHLAMRNAAEAKAELDAISDPASARYGQFLTDAEFEAKYAPTEADVAVVRAQLESQGLTVVEVPSNRAYIAATGTAAQMEQVFSTRLGEYKVGSEVRRAVMNAPSVAPDLQSRVAGVLGLTSRRAVSHRVQVGGVRTERSPDATGAPLTCSEWWGASKDTVDPLYGPGYPYPLPVAQCGFKPANVREAYGFTKAVRQGNDGTGVTIAIVDAFQSPTLLVDAQTYFAQNDPDYPLAASEFSARMAPGAVQTPDVGWYDEQSLDVESVHAMAPGANIAYVGAQSPSDVDLVAALNLIISKKLASIVSNSYGSPELAEPSNYVIWENITQQAGLKGVGLYFSSGDSGDENKALGFPSADFPASLATVTAVGGTSLALGSRGEIVFETGWESGRSKLLAPVTDAGASDAAAGDAGAAASVWTPSAPGAFRFGAGGGLSAIFPQPVYQAKVVPAAISNADVAAARVVPDVAMVADPVTGFIVGETVDGAYVEYPIGGTSLACPLFAGVMAIAQQHAKHTLGFANPALYKANAKSAYRDITPLASPQAAAVAEGIVYTFNVPGLAITTAKGYDNVTGMGVPNGEKFLSAIK